MIGTTVEDKNDDVTLIGANPVSADESGIVTEWFKQGKEAATWLTDGKVVPYDVKAEKMRQAYAMAQQQGEPTGIPTSILKEQASPFQSGSESLCYIEGQWAYFTTLPLSDQWGDDWNDAPYEHNAETPYEFHDNQSRSETPWEIKKLAFSGPLNTPADLAWSGNSNYSVEQINSGAVAWLTTAKGAAKTVHIFAGANIAQFCDLVEIAGGTVYLPRNPKCPLPK